MTRSNGGRRPLVSVIVVTHNSRGVLPACLASLERSTCAEDLEVIVVDNDSHDDTVAWIRDYQLGEQSKIFASFLFLPLGVNRGFAYANNRGIEQSNGKYILLLNPDTIVGERAIEVCVRRLREDSAIGAVGCRLELAGGKLDYACKRSLPTWWNSFCRFTRLSFLFPRSKYFAAYNLTYLDEYGSYEVECLSGAFMMVPRRVYDEVGGLDERFFMYGEDVDWCHRILRAGRRVWYEGSVTTLHLKGANGGRKTRKSKLAFYSSMFLYLSKWRFLRKRNDARACFEASQGVHAKP
ncbi:glycosyltransferase family 2 protein [Alicyclobacillus sendaiensis]|uniref:glycosyltransferase family 2 protein n=1 Tax=Alicyclobacillus sendaiensis TaxID=192387 RepID=UPI003D252D69